MDRDELELWVAREDTQVVFSHLFKSFNANETWKTCSVEQLKKLQGNQEVVDWIKEVLKGERQLEE